jgi:toxin YoeB
VEIVFSPQAIEDLQFWNKAGNKIIQKRIQALLISIQETPFVGIGNPRHLSTIYPAHGAGELIRNIVYFIP